MPAIDNPHDPVKSSGPGQVAALQKQVAALTTKVSRMQSDITALQIAAGITPGS